MKTRTGFWILLSIIGSMGTTDLLGQWVQQAFPTNEDLWKVRFLDSTTGWVLGTHHLYRTTDAGVHWIPQDTLFGGGGSTLCVIDRSTVLFSDYSSSRGIRRTSDGGSTWSRVDSSPIYYGDMEFLDSSLGFAAGGWSAESNTGIVRKTSDGGRTWRTVAQVPMGNSEQDFEGASFVDSLHGWAVSYYSGLVYHTSNGGKNWAFQDSLGRSPLIPILRPVRDIQFTTPDSGWAVGGLSGLVIIARTTDGGKTWSHQGTDGPSLREIWMLNSRVGWFVGSNSGAAIAKTTNGGESWQYQSSSPFDSRGFQSLSMVNESLGWVVGQGGRVAKTINGGGVVSVGESTPLVPSTFLLEQNYPNPFNPSTVVEFRIESSEFVALKVYDLLGQEVATLVNSVLQAGTHRVVFDAGAPRSTTLSSGVYFYRLTSGGQVRLKKMLLVR